MNEPLTLFWNSDARTFQEPKTERTFFVVTDDSKLLEQNLDAVFQPLKVVRASLVTPIDEVEPRVVILTTSGQSYKHFTIVINDPRVITWAIS